MENKFHLAIIPDGNRRWGKAHGKSLPESHAAGVEKFRDVIKWCKDLGVTTLSLWIFSTENATRSNEERTALSELFNKMLDRISGSKEFEKLRKDVKIKFVGKLDLFSDAIREKIRKVEEATDGDKQYTVNILAGYGGHQELVDAANRMIADVKAGKLDKIDSESFKSYLYLPEMPNPDLIFRSAGEKRLSGLFSWHSAYSEFYFCEKLWPDVSEEDFRKAIEEFKNRKRRFGQ